MDHVNETPICFPGEYFEGNFLNVGHTDYQTHEFEQVKIYPFRILSEAILHLCWNIKLFPKTVKKIKYIPNFQGILNWKLQIIIVKCNTEKTKTVSLLNKMLLLVSAFLSLIVFRAFCLVQQQSSQVLGPSTLAQKYFRFSTSCQK